MPRLHPLPPVPALLLAMLSIQAGAALAKGLFPAAGPYGTTALRVTLAAALLAAALRPDLRSLTWPQWRAIVPYGAALGAMNLAFYASLTYLPLGVAVTLEFLGPLVLALALSRRALDVLWVLLAGVGVWFITPHAGSAGGALPLPGVLLAVTAGALWALYIVAGGAVGRRVPGTTGVVAGMLVAALVTLPLGLGPAVGALDARVLLVALGVAALSSALPYTLEMRALRTIPARVFGVMMSVEPAVAALSGLLFLHERLAPGQWAAMLCVIAASAGINATRPRPAPPPPPTGPLPPA